MGADWLRAMWDVGADWLMAVWNMGADWIRAVWDMGADWLSICLVLWRPEVPFPPMRQSLCEDTKTEQVFVAMAQHQAEGEHTERQH